MLEHLKSDLFVMTKMKVAYILPIILVVMSLLVGVVLMRMNIDTLLPDTDALMVNTEDDSSMGDDIVSSFETGFEVGLKVSAPSTEANSITELFSGGPMEDATVADITVENISGLTEVLLVGIFAAFFVGCDLKGGFRKNVIKSNANRWIAFGSKMVAIFIYTLFFQLFSYLIDIPIVAMFGSKMDLGIDSGFVIYFIVSTFLTYGFACLCALVAMVAGGSTLAMIFAIVAGSGLLNLLFMLIDTLIQFLTKNDEFETSKYLITGNLSALPYMTEDYGDYVRPIVVAICFIVVPIVISGFVNDRKDYH